MRRQAWADCAPMVGLPILPKGMQGPPPRKDRKSAGETARMAMARHHRQRLIEVTPLGMDFRAHDGVARPREIAHDGGYRSYCPELSRRCCPP